MKRDIIKWIQIANAATLLLFCVLCSFMQDGTQNIDEYGLAILIGGSAILLQYFPYLLKFPGVSEEASRGSVGVSIPGSWFIATLWLRMFLDYDGLMTYLALTFLLAFIVLGICYLKKHGIIHFPNRKKG